jgi:hypothetical protein
MAEVGRQEAETRFAQLAGQMKAISKESADPAELEAARTRAEAAEERAAVAKRLANEADRRATAATERLDASSGRESPRPRRRRKTPELPARRRSPYGDGSLADKGDRPVFYGDTVGNLAFMMPSLAPRAASRRANGTRVTSTKP